MGRIRTIKPEFPQSESIGSLSRDARLLFLQIWTIADDEGRARGNSRMVASLLYPYDSDAGGLIEGWMQELESKGHIRRYIREGHFYLEVVNWLKHQKIDKPSLSKLPAFLEDSTNPLESSRGVAVGREGIKEGIKEGKGRDVDRQESPSHDTVDTRILSESVGIFDMRQQADMNRLLTVHMKESGRTVDQAITHMIGRWELYKSLLGTLEWQYGSSYKFFTGDFWDNPDGWPRAGVSRREREREAAFKKFRENGGADEAE